MSGFEPQTSSTYQKQPHYQPLPNLFSSNFAQKKIFFVIAILLQQEQDIVWHRCRSNNARGISCNDSNELCKDCTFDHVVDVNHNNDDNNNDDDNDNDDNNNNNNNNDDNDNNDDPVDVHKSNLTRCWNKK